jgi:hypothetical protein
MIWQLDLTRNSARFSRKLVGTKRTCPLALWRKSRRAGLQGTFNLDSRAPVSSRELVLLGRKEAP